MFQPSFFVKQSLEKMYSDLSFGKKNPIYGRWFKSKEETG